MSRNPHPDGDVAELRPYLDFDAGAEALAAITVYEESPEGDISSHLMGLAEWPARLGPVFLRRGVVAWNLIDDDGPVPVTPEALAALRWEEAYELADRADDLYGGPLLSPLVKRANAFSKAGRTNGSTPRPRPSSRKPRKPSVSSS